MHVFVASSRIRGSGDVGMPLAAVCYKNVSAVHNVSWVMNLNKMVSFKILLFSMFSQ
jgi:hypothetical protein